MERDVIRVRPREESGSSAVRKLRNRGVVPAVLYGGSGGSRPLSVEAKELDRVLHRGRGENILVELNLRDEKGGEEKKVVLVKEVQHDVVRGTVLHIDFNEVAMDELITAPVPLREVGEAVGVKRGGVLEHPMREVEVECLPGDLPEVIEVDVSDLDIGKSIHVSELRPPEGVKVLSDPEWTVFACAAPRVEEEAAPEEAPAEPAEVEVIGEKKKEEAGEAEK